MPSELLWVHMAPGVNFDLSLQTRSRKPPTPSEVHPVTKVEFEVLAHLLINPRTARDTSLT